MLSPRAITTYARAMIVAVMKPLNGEKANGSRIPRPIITAVNARLNHGGRASRTASTRERSARRHSRTCAISSSTSSSSSSRFSRLLAQEAARPQGHDQDQVREDDRRRPLGADAGIGDLLDDPDDDPAENGAAHVPDPPHDGGREGDQARLEALEVPERCLVQ